MSRYDIDSSGGGKGFMATLRNKLDSNNPDERVAAAKNVVALMRAGENVGGLFSSMLRVVKTEDIQVKRLVYHYLITYSLQEPEQAIMVVNTFIKDSEDYNPIVRALAVRSMCRIKLGTVAEYMIVPLKKCLADKDAYVRKTAVMAVAKLYEVVPESVETSELLGLLVSCLRDENPMVVSNTAAALFEINERRQTPYFVFNEETVSPVISALTQCSDWVKTMLLDALARYTPVNGEEATFLIDRLIPFLKNVNPAVVISSMKCIYAFMEKDTRNRSELFEKIIPPFISLVSYAEPEVQFVVLRTLSLFVVKYPKALARETRVFFCKYNDPSYVKLEKLDIIVTICSGVNVQLVIDELEEYCNAVDVGFVRKSISSLGQICLKVPVASRRCVDVLVKQVESKAEYAVEEAVVVLCDILRAFPGEFEGVIAKVCANIESMKDAKSRASAIWILGEYCHLIEKVDALLDPFLDSFQDEDPDVQMQLLTAFVKVFLHNPEETKDQLQFVLTEATKETITPDIRNRAFFFWRLLSNNQALAKEIIVFEKEAVTAQSDAWDDVVLTELIQSMGTVAGVMHVVTSDFVRKGKYVPEETEDLLNFEEEREWIKASMQGDTRAVDVFYDWQPNILWLKVVNKTDDPLTQFALAFDKSVLGIEIESPPQFPPQLEFGDSFEVKVPLRYNPNFIGNLSSLELRVALRTSVGAKYFVVPFDLTCITQPTGPVTMEAFNAGWSSNAESTETVVEDAKVAESGIFSGRSIFLVGKEGDTSNLVFVLPTGKTYYAKATQNDKNVSVVVHGDPSLFAIIINGANSMFCA